MVKLRIPDCRTRQAVPNFGRISIKLKKQIKKFYRTAIFWHGSKVRYLLDSYSGCKASDAFLRVKRQMTR